MSVQRLYVELQRRLELEQKLWELFKDDDFVHRAVPAGDLGERAASALKQPLNNVLRFRIREALLGHGIIAVLHSGHVCFRHADWRRIVREERAAAKLAAMDPRDVRIRELERQRRESSAT